MGGVTSVLPHLSEFEVSIRLKQTAGREHRRWLVIWNALVDPRPASEIALHTGVSLATVYSVVSRYNRFGPEAIKGHEHGIRRRCYRSKGEEAEFLKEEGHHLKVSASFGIAHFPSDADDIKGLLAAADQCLYQSKHAGKNRITIG